MLTFNERRVREALRRLEDGSRQRQPARVVVREELGQLRFSHVVVDHLRIGKVGDGRNGRERRRRRRRRRRLGRRWRREGRGGRRRTCWWRRRRRRRRVRRREGRRRDGREGRVRSSVRRRGRERAGRRARADERRRSVPHAQPRPVDRGSVGRKRRRRRPQRVRREGRRRRLLRSGRRRGRRGGSLGAGQVRAAEALVDRVAERVDFVDVVTPPSKLVTPVRAAGRVLGRAVHDHVHEPIEVQVGTVYSHRKGTRVVGVPRQRVFQNGGLELVPRRVVRCGVDTRSRPVSRHD